ncbi:MAG: hypothetical protein ACRCTJ_02195, partial [Brevinema sp.]
LSYRYAPRLNIKNADEPVSDGLFVGLKFSIPLAYNYQHARYLEDKYNAQKTLLEKENFEREIGFAALTRSAEWEIVQRDLSAREEIVRISKAVIDGSYTR